jgi:hypothetical protein
VQPGIVGMPSPWALSIIKCDAQVIMNLNICRSWRLGFLCIQLKSGRDLVPT